MWGPFLRVILFPVGPVTTSWVVKGLQLVVVSPFSHYALSLKGFSARPLDVRLGTFSDPRANIGSSKVEVPLALGG